MAVHSFSKNDCPCAHTGVVVKRQHVEGLLIYVEHKEKD